jgi:phosphoglycerol transferase MdoB-like AlkP superfamily enzyme
MDKTLRKKYIQAYAEQVDYLNQKIIKMIDDIFAQSVTPPIIILQADHGPRSATDLSSFRNTNWRERFSILNAIYLPGKKSVLYEGITPVNTFRLILNEYFATNYQKLPDKKIFSH